MPKNRGSSRGRNEKKARSGNPLLMPKLIRDGTDSNIGSDDESIPDNMSVISFASNNTKLETDTFEETREEGETGDDGFYDDSEEKIQDAISNATDKSTKSRILALEYITRAFRTRYMFDFIDDRKMTIMDIIERSIKKGKGEEQGVAATLSSVLATTLGPGDEHEALFKDLSGLLVTVLPDASASASVRAKCASAIGLNLFIHGDARTTDGEVIESVMDTLAANFCGSCLKGNGQVQTNLTPAVTAMHASSLMAWSLLLTIQSTAAVLRLAEKLGKKISELLESADVDVRVAAGETIAILYEICRETNEDFELQNHYDLIDKLKLLATDSQKFRAKKDRRIQKSSFRDIFKAVEDGGVPSVIIKFPRERLFIDSWCRKRQYDSFCSVLGSGMNLHLTQNELLRDIFSLGSPVVDASGTGSKVSKFERHMENLAASKARKITRGRLRDKRADVIE